MSKLLSTALPIAASVFLPGVGSALGGSILGAGAAGSATLGNALLGGGLGALTGGGLKGALMGAAGGALGANIGNLGSAPLASGAAGPSMPGSGILGSIGSATGLNTGNLPSLGGLIGSGGGGSTFNMASGLANLAGGYADDEALKKAQKQLLEGNQQQLANLESYNMEDYMNDPAYQFQKGQGEQALNRTLGAQGNVFSGRALQAASDLNRNLAADFEKTAYQRWLEKTGQQNQLIGSSGNTRAATSIARGNNLSSSLVSALAPQQGLSLEQLKKLGLTV